MKKRCPWCGKLKELTTDNFSHRGKDLKRWDSPCKPCKSAYMIQYRKDHPEKVAKYISRYHEPLEGIPASRGRERWVDFKAYWSKNPIYFALIWKRKLTECSLLAAYKDLMRILNNKQNILRDYFCQTN